MPQSFVPIVIAMASPGQQPGWISVLPFAMIFAIFYVLILLPMKRRQKKIQEFQSALKVGDKVVTTSGIWGQITDIDDKTVQLQVADKVRIRMARHAIGGMQGQAPVVPESGS
jgi:preprotein translocase subunit YajC